MAEWLYEAGIGESRAALVEGGHILELAIERDDQPGPRAGAILPSRLVRKADASGRGLVTLDGGQSAQLMPVPQLTPMHGSGAAQVMLQVVPDGQRPSQLLIGRHCPPAQY